MNVVKTRRRVVVDNSQLARTIGGRIRQARKAAGLTQSQLAGDRYTKAYISALESGISKPSMAALDYLAPRLGTTAAEILTDPSAAWSRLEADLALASGDWARALDAYRGLAEGEQERGTRGELLTAISECLCRLDRPAEAIRPASEAAGLLAQLGRTDAQLRAEYWLASAHHQQDNPDEARSILRSVLDRLRATPHPDPDFATRLLIGLAMVEAYQGKTSAALAYLEEARVAAAALDDRRRGTFLSTVAIAQREAGDHEGALRAGLQALALLRSAESALEAELIANDLALTYLAAGNHERARALAEESRLTAAARGDERQVAILTDTQSVIALATGDAEQALALAREAIRLAERTAHRKTLLDGLVSEARALARLGRHDEALASFERAAALAEEAAPASRRREIMSAWADSLAQLGRHDEAYALARRALAFG
jgi:transcriptional regulator with XRE-family HTH domain